MTTQVDARAQIERYLLRLRGALGNVSAEEKAEILSDLRNHLEESAGAVAAAIAALGSPEELAASYHRERLLARASTTPEPSLLLRATFQWALTGLRGVLAFLVLLFGYSFSAGFLICALLKPFMPNQVGMWLHPPAITLGVVSEPGAHELLGWWMIPIGFTVGPLLLIGTTRLIQLLLRRRAARHVAML